MSLNTAQLEYLASKGLSLSDAIELSRLGDIKKDPTAAERKRRQRERENNMSHRDVTRDTPLDKEIPPKPPKEIKPPLPPVISNEITPPAAENENDGDAPLTVAELVEDWNGLAEATGLPKVAKLTDRRLRRAKVMLRQYPEIELWQRAFANIRGSPFCLGQNDRGWKADFDFLLQDKSFSRLIEGSYGQAH